MTDNNHYDHADQPAEQPGDRLAAAQNAFAAATGLTLDPAAGAHPYPPGPEVPEPRPIPEPQPDPEPMPGPLPEHAEQQAAEAAQRDQDTVLGVGRTFTLKGGMTVTLRPLMTRELFALLRVVTAGIGPQIAAQRLNPDEDEDVFLAKFAGMVLMSLPNAEDEVMAFLRQVVTPTAVITDGRLDKAIETRNARLVRDLDVLLYNPDPDDTITIIEQLAAAEAGNVRALGKRLAGIFRLAQRTGLIPNRR